jgi:hypothetical protein
MLYRGLHAVAMACSRMLALRLLPSAQYVHMYIHSKVVFR